MGIVCLASAPASDRQALLHQNAEGLTGAGRLGGSGRESGERFTGEVRSRTVQNESRKVALLVRTAEVTGIDSIAEFSAGW